MTGTPTRTPPSVPPIGPPLVVVALPSQTVAGWRRGGLDAYGLVPERVASSSGAGTPCRHCLAQVPAGRPYLIVAHRPFGGLNPYAETGPLFVCADDCARGGGAALPAAMLTAATYLLRGYSRDERIVYGSGGVVPTGEISARCAALFAQDEIAAVHVRSATNNCYFFRVERG